MSERSPLPQSTESCVEHRLGILDKGVSRYHAVETIWKEINIVGRSPLLLRLSRVTALQKCRVLLLCSSTSWSSSGLVEGELQGSCAELEYCFIKMVGKFSHLRPSKTVMKGPPSSVMKSNKNICSVCLPGPVLLFFACLSEHLVALNTFWFCSVCATAALPFTF